MRASFYSLGTLSAVVFLPARADKAGKVEPHSPTPTHTHTHQHTLTHHSHISNCDFGRCRSGFCLCCRHPQPSGGQEWPCSALVRRCSPCHTSTSIVIIVIINCKANMRASKHLKILVCFVKNKKHSHTPTALWFSRVAPTKFHVHYPPFFRNPTRHTHIKKEEREKEKTRKTQKRQRESECV